MRSIGKRNITKLKAIVQEEYDKSRTSFSTNQYDLTEKIKARIPTEWYDIWESAWSEIERLIDDEVSRLIYQR